MSRPAEILSCETATPFKARFSIGMILYVFDGVWLMDCDGLDVGFIGDGKMTWAGTGGARDLKKSHAVVWSLSSALTVPRFFLFALHFLLPL